MLIAALNIFWCDIFSVIINFYFTVWCFAGVSVCVSFVIGTVIFAVIPAVVIRAVLNPFFEAVFFDAVRTEGLCPP